MVPLTPEQRDRLAHLISHVPGPDLLRLAFINQRQLAPLLTMNDHLLLADYCQHVIEQNLDPCGWQSRTDYAAHRERHLRAAQDRVADAMARFVAAPAELAPCLP